MKANSIHLKILNVVFLAQLPTVSLLAQAGNLDASHPSQPTYAQTVSGLAGGDYLCIYPLQIDNFDCAGGRTKGRRFYLETEFGRGSSISPFVMWSNTKNKHDLEQVPVGRSAIPSEAFKFFGRDINDMINKASSPFVESAMPDVGEPVPLLRIRLKADDGYFSDTTISEEIFRIRADRNIQVQNDSTFPAVDVNQGKPDTPPAYTRNNVPGDLTEFQLAGEQMGKRANLRSLIFIRQESTLKAYEDRENAGSMKAKAEQLRVDSEIQRKRSETMLADAQALEQKAIEVLERVGAVTTAKLDNSTVGVQSEGKASAKPEKASDAVPQLTPEQFFDLMQAIP